MTRFLMFCKHVEGILESMLKTLVYIFLAIAAWKALAWLIAH